MGKLTLLTQYANARSRRLLARDMAPMVRAMHWFRLWKQAREDYADLSGDIERGHQRDTLIADMNFYREQHVAARAAFYQQLNSKALEAA